MQQSIITPVMGQHVIRSGLSQSPSRSAMPRRVIPPSLTRRDAMSAPHDDRPDQPAPSGGAWRRWFFGLFVSVALVGAILHFGEIKNFARLLTQAEPAWLALAVPFQISDLCERSLGLVVRPVARRDAAPYIPAFLEQPPYFILGRIVTRQK